MLARESVGSNGRMEAPGFPQEFARNPHKARESKAPGKPERPLQME